MYSTTVHVALTIRRYCTYRCVRNARNLKIEWWLAQLGLYVYCAISVHELYLHSSTVSSQSHNIVNSQKTKRHKNHHEIRWVASFAAFLAGTARRQGVVVRSELGLGGSPKH